MKLNISEKNDIFWGKNISKHFPAAKHVVKSIYKAMKLPEMTLFFSRPYLIMLTHLRARGERETDRERERTNYGLRSRLLLIRLPVFYSCCSSRPHATVQRERSLFVNGIETAWSHSFPFTQWDGRAVRVRTLSARIQITHHFMFKNCEIIMNCSFSLLTYQ